jgi:hypothetical protein
MAKEEDDKRVGATNNTSASDKMIEEVEMRVDVAIDIHRQKAVSCRKPGYTSRPTPAQP